MRQPGQPPMTPGDRILDWLGYAGDWWGEKLGSWAMKFVERGITKSLTEMEPGAIAAYRASLTKLKDNPLTPPELKEFLEKALGTGNLLNVVGGIATMILGSLGALLGGSQPLGNLIRYQQDLLLKTARLDEGSAITAWRRDPTKYADVWQDLKEQGWDQSRIDTLKFITEFMPSPRDLVEWQAKEVFEPTMIEDYGLLEEFGELDLSLFAKVGVTEDQARNFWIAHWEHASWTQVLEMLRRGQLTEEEVKRWFRLVEIPPYWRQKLINISWEVPTRVDVRRFWDMRTIDEARLREIYTSLGYHGKDLEDYVLWTKIYVDFPTLLARYKNGWITLDDVKAELVAMGMSADRADIMIEEKIKKEAPERVASEKNLTKTDIFKGVKQGRITRDEGLELLVDIGYGVDEALYLLAINIPEDQVDQVVEERQLTKADILTGLKTAVITREEARAKLLELRYSQANVDLLLKIFDAQVKPPEETKLKEASKADIVSAVKKGLITQEEGYMMLLDIGFDPEAALFILSVATEESPFSPINYQEFKALTQKYRKASGIEGVPMSDELKWAAAEVVRLTTDRDSLQQSIERERRGLLTEGILPAAATERLTQLQTSLRLVEAELFRAKTEYDRLVAEFKYTLP